MELKRQSPSPDGLDTATLPRPSGEIVTAEDFLASACWVLKKQGFVFSQDEKQHVLSHSGEEVLRAPTVSDLILLLIITGAWCEAANAH